MTFGEIFKALIPGLSVSAKIFFITLLFALPLGLIFCFGRMSRFFILRNITKLLISVLRGTPLMLQLFVVFFGPFYIFGIKLSSSYRLMSVFIGFSINYAAYFAEIYRGGIESIPIGQYEAAKLLGYSKSQTFIRIIFPQVIKRITPSITNEVITLVKDTSLAFVLSVTEMFTKSKELASAQGNMMPFIAAGIIFYVINLVIAMVSERLEKKMSFFK